MTKHYDGSLPYQQLNAREYAAIHLGIPDSGTEWLDEMIRQSTGKARKSREQAVEPSGDFECFWNVYPRKQAKPDAQRAFAKAIKKVSLDTIMQAIALQKLSDEWRKKDGVFIPYPASWLNAERWSDSVSTISAAHTITLSNGRTYPLDGPDPEQKDFKSEAEYVIARQQFINKQIQS